MVDLRGNPGGLLTSVCAILNSILPEGLIVYTEDKYGNRSEERSEGKTPLDMPFAVLVNENSASASEILPERYRIMESAPLWVLLPMEKAWFRSFAP